MKNSLKKLISRLDTAEEKISKIEAISIEIIQNETKIEKE